MKAPVIKVMSWQITKTHAPVAPSEEGAYFNIARVTNLSKRQS